MSVLTVLYYALTIFIVWLLILSIVIGVMLIRLIQQMQLTLKKASSTLESLRPSNYLNAQMAGNLVRWGIERVFKQHS